MKMCMFMQNALTRLLRYFNHLHITFNHFFTKVSTLNLMLILLFSQCRLPLISVAVVEGRALGGGAELVTACDFR